VHTAADLPVANVPAAVVQVPQVLMRLRYGLNLGDRWGDLLAGSAAQELLSRIREAGTEQVRVFLGRVADRPTSDWPECVGLLEAIARAGATPTIALAQPSEWRDPRAVRNFARDCAEFVDRACERWGADAVASWYWSIGDEPNSPWTNNGLTFEAYKDIYQAVASGIRQRIGGADGTRPRIGGPSIDGFQPFWFDWLWRFVEEVDDSLIGFVAWNRYGDWREPGSWSAPVDPEIFRTLLLSRTGEYWSRSVTLRNMLDGRGILNICSELNAHSHTEPAISATFNQGIFGAVYYGSALIELMRGGADGEFLWAGACADGPYAALDEHGGTTPAYEAKRLIARHVRFSDRVIFPLDADPETDLDAVVAWNQSGQRAAILVHRACARRSFELGRWPALTGFSEMTRLTANRDDHLAARAFGGVVDVEGYAVILLR
jgi:hypothetical protein